MAYRAEKYHHSVRNVAMVVVAAIALGSSTYIWFVSNNTVTAVTTNISAQSNSAYLVIDTKTTSTSSTSSATAAEEVGEGKTYADKALYPAQWANGFDESKGTSGTKVYQFETAYAAAKGASTEKENTRFAVGAPEAAVTADYALKNQFYIDTGTYDGEFTKLVVSNITLSAPTADIANAMRVLVKCGDNWQIWKYDSAQSKGVQVTTYKTTAADEVAFIGYGKYK